MFEDRTRDNIKAEMLAMVQTSTGLTALEGGYADHTFGPMSVKLEEAYARLRGLVAFLAFDETCGALLDVVADNVSMQRKEGRKATATISLTGTPLAHFPAGTAFLTEDGLEFTLDASVQLGEDGKGEGTLTATSVGAAYNVKEGALTRMYVNLATLDSFVNSAATGGADLESNASLYGRIDAHFREPATSGNPAQVRQWATEVDGVAYAKVVSLVDGNGTVGVTLVGADMTPVDQTVVQAVAANIMAKRTVGIDADPYVKSATPLVVNITAVSELDTSTTPAEVKAKLAAQLKEYFALLVKEKYGRNYEGPDEDVGYTMIYNRVATMLMTVPGVLDYTSLTINGQANDLTIGADQVPVLGEVTVT